MSFGAAHRRLDAVSPALNSANYAVDAARDTERAVSTLDRPLVTVSAQYLEYQKTFAVDLTGRKQEAIGEARDFLSGLPSTLPPAFREIAADIVGRITAALPGLYAAIPDELRYRFRDDVFRPTVQGIVPLYTGGAIRAIKDSAKAGTASALAQADQARELARLNLIRAYFGQITAEGLEDSAAQSLAALDDVLRDAQKLEAAGVTPRSSTLEAQVARDTAFRVWERAAIETQSARTDLARLLDVAAVRPTTPLFVMAGPLPPAASFFGPGGTAPAIRGAEAAEQTANAEVRLARSQLRPQAFAFGEYNFNRDRDLPTEPDWVVGVAVRYTLLSNIGRRSALNATKSLAAAAGEAARGARRDNETTMLRAWNFVEAARRSFVSLESSVVAAQENLRVQRVAFREGEGTATAVLIAEAALAGARAERIATAYEYDLALAGFLTAAGVLDSFPHYVDAAAIRVPGEVLP